MANPESNIYAGGVNFSSTIGNGVQTAMQFDLPLATVASFNDRALSFLGSNSERNYGFLDRQIQSAQSGVNAARGQSIGFMNSGIRIMQSNFNRTMDMVDRQMQQLDWAAARARTSMQIGNQQVLQANKGWCFVTTAICEAEGKSDDCAELQILRAFRDDVMMRDAETAELVSRYYMMAPRLVRRIRMLPENGAHLLAELKTRYLIPAIRQVLTGDHDGAIKTYSRMLQFAETKTGA